MRHVKMLVLSTMTAAILMALLGTGAVSATVLCSTTTTPCNAKWPVGTELDLSAEQSTKLREIGGETLDTCNSSTIKGHITNAGSATTTVTAKLTKLEAASCTFPTTILEFGKIEIHNISGSDNGTVTAEGIFRMTVNTIFFGSCVYGAEGSRHIGTLTEGKPATFDTNTETSKISGSEIACPATAIWEATYLLTEPRETTLSVEPS